MGEDSIEYEDFTRVDLRIGTVTAAWLNPKARNPAYVLTVDLGAGDLKTSSAQITEHYTPDDLVGRQVVCVCNFEPKRIAGIKSEVLVLGAHDKDGHVVLASFAQPVPDGTPLR